MIRAAGIQIRRTNPVRADQQAGRNAGAIEATMGRPRKGK